MLKRVLLIHYNLFKFKLNSAQIAKTKHKTHILESQKCSKYSILKSFMFLSYEHLDFDFKDRFITLRLR